MALGLYHAGSRLPLGGRTAHLQATHSYAINTGAQVLPAGNKGCWVLHPPGHGHQLPPPRVLLGAPRGPPHS